MFQTWVARFVTVVFFFEILFPSQVFSQALLPQKPVVDVTKLDYLSQSTPSYDEYLKKGGANELAREQDPFRQTELAKEIVAAHVRGNAHADIGRVAKAARAAYETMQNARKEYNKKFEPPASTREWREQKVYTSDHGKYGDNTNPQYEPDFAQIYAEAFTQNLLGPLKARISSPDFTIVELLEYIDPYTDVDYDPLLTAIAAETMSTVLQIMLNTAVHNMDLIEGMAAYASELEQRALYRLSYIERKRPVTKRSVPETHAVGALRQMLWNLQLFEKNVIAKHKEIYSYYNSDSIFATQVKGESYTTVQFKRAVSDMTEIAKAYVKDDTPDAHVSTISGMVISYGVSLAFQRDRPASSSNKQDPDKAPSGDQWSNVELLWDKMESFAKKYSSNRHAQGTPSGDYEQPIAGLYPALTASIQQNITKKDVEESRGKNLISFLRKEADTSSKSTVSVVFASELASYLMRKNGLKLSNDDKRYFSRALESIYCRAAVAEQSDLYSSNGVKQNLGSNQYGYANKAHIRFESFGFSDVAKQAVFVRGLAKLHRTFGLPDTVLRKVDPKVDRLVSFEERKGGMQMERKSSALPSGEFYFKCKIDVDFPRSPVLETRQVSKALLAVLLEIPIWLAFDAVFAAVGMVATPIIRSGWAGVRALPRAFEAAGEAARSARLAQGASQSGRFTINLASRKALSAGLSAGTREVKDAVRLAKNFSDVQAHGGTMTAVSIAGTDTPQTTTALTVAANYSPIGRTPKPATVARPWTNWTNMTNRHFFGTGWEYAEIETLTLQQGARSVAINMRELGLEHGIQTLRDWEKVMEAAQQQKFMFQPLTGAALRQARAEAYLAAQAMQKIAKQNWLQRHLPNSTKFWKYDKASDSWVRITQEKFMEMHEDLQIWAQYQGTVAGSAATAAVDAGKAVAEKASLYRVLGVSRKATDLEIKQAYKAKAVKSHSDKFAKVGNHDDEPFKELAAAYDVLRNPAKRAQHDRFLEALEHYVEADEVGNSIAITFGDDVFIGSNGISFGLSSPAGLRDLTGTVLQYMQEHNMINLLGVEVAKMSPRLQGSYHAITRALPTFFGLDYLAQSPFRNSLMNRIESEQEAVVEPLKSQMSQTSVNTALETERQKKAAEAKQNEVAANGQVNGESMTVVSYGKTIGGVQVPQLNTPQGTVTTPQAAQWGGLRPLPPSFAAKPQTGDAQTKTGTTAVEPYQPLYNQVKAVEPLVGTWLGMPSLSFVGSSMGYALFNGWQYGLEPLSPWKLHLVNKQMRADLFNITYSSIAHNTVLDDNTMSTLVKQEVMRLPYQQRDKQLSEFVAKYGEEASKEIRGYWDSYLQDLENILFRKDTKKDGQTEGQETENDTKELEKQIDALRENLQVNLFRAQRRASMAAGRREYMKKFPAGKTKPEHIQKLNEMYDQYEKDVEAVLNRKLSADQLEKTANELKKMFKDFEQQILRQVATFGLETYLQVTAPPLEKAADNFRTQYQILMKTSATDYSDAVQQKLTGYLEPTVAQIEAVLADTKLTDEQKADKVAAIENETRDRFSTTLLENEPDYVKKFERRRARDKRAIEKLKEEEQNPKGDKKPVAGRAKGLETVINKLFALKEQELHALLAEVADKPVQERKEKMAAFFQALSSKSAEIFFSDLEKNDPQGAMLVKVFASKLEAGLMLEQLRVLQNKMFKNISQLQRDKEPNFANYFASCRKAVEEVAKLFTSTDKQKAVTELFTAKEAEFNKLLASIEEQPMQEKQEAVVDFLYNLEKDYFQVFGVDINEFKNVVETTKVPSDTKPAVVRE